MVVRNWRAAVAVAVAVAMMSDCSPLVRRTGCAKVVDVEFDQ